MITINKKGLEMESEILNRPRVKREKVSKKGRNEVISFLRKKYFMSENLFDAELKVHHLWDDFYRLNYWGKRASTGDYVIVDSMFIRVDEINGEYIVKHLNEGERRRDIISKEI